MPEQFMLTEDDSVNQYSSSARVEPKIATVKATTATRHKFG